jgi:hypothetical protein
MFGVTVVLGLDADRDPALWHGSQQGSHWLVCVRRGVDGVGDATMACYEWGRVAHGSAELVARSRGRSASSWKGVPKERPPIVRVIVKTSQVEVSRGCRCLTGLARRLSDPDKVSGAVSPDTHISMRGRPWKGRNGITVIIGLASTCGRGPFSPLNSQPLTRIVLSVFSTASRIRADETHAGRRIRESHRCTEARIKTQGLTLDTPTPSDVTVEAASLTCYGDQPMQCQASVANLKQAGHYANFVLLMECGHCGYKSPVETQAGDMTRQCYCCGAINNASRGTITVYTDKGMVQI